MKRKGRLEMQKDLITDSFRVREAGFKILSQSDSEPIGSINKHREQEEDTDALRYKLSVVHGSCSPDVSSSGLKTLGKAPRPGKHQGNHLT